MPFIAEKDIRSSSFHYEWHLKYELISTYTKTQMPLESELVYLQENTNMKKTVTTRRTNARHEYKNYNYNNKRHVAALQIIVLKGIESV